MSDHLGAVYGVAVGCLALSYGIRTILLLSLRPRGALEWSTTAGAVTIFFFFGVLFYWIEWDHRAPPPVVYGPLVVAAIACGVASVAFTVAAVRDWESRRYPKRKGVSRWSTPQGPPR